MPRPLKFTLIGAGGSGGAHLRALGQMEMEGHARLTDVVDPFPELLPELRQSLKEGQVRWYRSWEELLDGTPIPDAVAIAAPIHLHMDYAQEAHEVGAYVYMERPPVPLLSQIDQLIAMELLDSPRIQVGFAFPHSQQIQALKGRTLEGKLGGTADLGTLV